MCRIFGFRSILQSGVHKSLIDADNSIIHQSDRHPDGWGVAYYNMGSPHLVKLDQQAKQCKIFEKVSGVVASNTVVTHIRKSTIGDVGPLNTHPFQYGPWVFAHNGNIENFKELRGHIIKRIDIELRPYILGETDSEYLFYLLLSIIKRKGFLKPNSQKKMNFKPVLSDFLLTIKSIAGPIVESQGDYDKNYITFVLTNGQSMYAFNGGQQLYFSTHKTLCSERAECKHFHPLCESVATKNQKVHHLLISSEVIKNENIWTPIKFGECVGVDRDFIFKQNLIPMSS